MSKLLIIFLSSLFVAKCLIENQEGFKFFFSDMRVDEIGKIGTAVARFNQESQKFTIVDTKKEPCFESEISNGKETYKVQCGLWREEEQNYILIFCNIESNIPPGEYYLLNETKSFKYKSYDVTLTGCNKVKFTKVDQNIIDLYGGTKAILIEDTTEPCELQFNIVSYDQQPLFLHYNMPVENCTAKDNILRCTMPKTDLLAYLSPKDTYTNVYFLKNNNVPFQFPLVHSIKIYIREFPKKDIFVGIKKLLTNINEERVPIAYETNVTDISKVNNDERSHFQLTFKIKNKDQENEKEEKKSCELVKYDNNPLLILCWIGTEGISSLKEITQEIILNDINFQYNFRIQPAKNNETSMYIGKGVGLAWNYPRVLDFKKNNGPLYINYQLGENPDSFKGLTFNVEKDDLKCQTILESTMRCEVPKSHFQGKTDGYYFHQLSNNLDKKSIRYELSPMKVFVGDSDSKKGRGNFLSLSINYLVLFILMFINL